ncbi:MAG: hypothetical protein Q8K63_04845, partial [Acidimicrobiales bacterium]|nr:hypothetical protein [Acidimicrobiales bacterium]
KRAVLDQTLAASETTGIVVATGYLVLHGSTETPNRAPDCAKAVALLNKSNFAGKKMASDPAFNMAAQLVAARLNYVAGAAQPAAATDAITQAVALLAKYKFTGAGYTGKISAADAAAMHALANTLDQYNNNLL